VTLRFKSSPEASAVDVAEQSLTVTVNIPARSVRLGEVQRSVIGFDAPFALVAPLRVQRPSPGGPPASDREGVPERPGAGDRPGMPGRPSTPERDRLITEFFERIRLGDLIDELRRRHGGVAAFNTYWDTAYDTDYETSTPVDTAVDTWTQGGDDHITDVEVDSARDRDNMLDYKIDGKNDPGDGILIEPTRG
jgi:hypothetical protein